MQSRAKTVSEYLAALPPDRRAEVARVRAVIRRNLPKGYREEMAWGMIGYVIPLSKHADTYNGQPLCYAALASQKNHLSLYMMGAYTQRAAIKAAFVARGKKLDMGGACIRFKSADDLPIEELGQLIGAISPEDYILYVESQRWGRKRSAKKSPTKKSPSDAETEEAAPEKTARKRATGNRAATRS